MVEIIPEFCQNHNGVFEILKNMVYAAKESGATQGKIQTIFFKDLTNRPRFENGLVENNKIITIKRPFDSQYERLKRLDLSFDQQREFLKICKIVKMRNNIHGL